MGMYGAGPSPQGHDWQAIWQLHNRLHRKGLATWFWGWVIVVIIGWTATSCKGLDLENNKRGESWWGSMSCQILMTELLDVAHSKRAIPVAICEYTSKHGGIVMASSQLQNEWSSTQDATSCALPWSRKSQLSNAQFIGDEFHGRLSIEWGWLCSKYSSLLRIQDIHIYIYTYIIYTYTYIYTCDGFDWNM